jgi:hypothetical protein
MRGMCAASVTSRRAATLLCHEEGEKGPHCSLRAFPFVITPA